MGVLKSETLHDCIPLENPEVVGLRPRDGDQVVVRWRCEVCGSEWHVQLWAMSSQAACIVRRRLKPKRDTKRICRLPNWL